jgi:hypothetical protein
MDDWRGKPNCRVLALAGVCGLASLFALLALTVTALAGAASFSDASAGGIRADCGLPTAQPLWIDYGEGAVPPEVRAVFARPGVVLAASGTALPAQYRAKGAATVYFVLHLPAFVGEPGTPADPASIQAGADRLYDSAVASTGCSTPVIGLNELLAAQAPTPWSPTNAQYRANVLALLERLAARGARPQLLVHGDPNVSGDAAAWWKKVGAVADIIYEAYYNARNIDALGPVLGTRRMRLGMRSIVSRFTGVGIPAERLGFALGFQVALGAAGREGLQPREEWFRVVKWEALAARQVALDEGTSTIWSWGWATFGPQSADPDKPAAACVYLWTRDPSLCDGPAVAGPAFNASLTEGPIVLPPGVQCAFPEGAVSTAAVAALSALTRSPQLALTALFARAALRGRVPVAQTAVLAAEQQVVKRVFHGSLRSYLRALEQQHAARAVARGVIADELRRRLIAALPETQAPNQTTLLWSADLEAAAVHNATCLRDELPGTGDFPASNEREVGAVPLPAYLPFLFSDRTAPAPPQALTATPAPAAITLDWADSREPDLVGYHVYRAPAPGGPYVRLTENRLARSTFVDSSAPPGAISYYAVRAVDTSRNRSDLSFEASAVPGAA